MLLPYSAIIFTDASRLVTAENTLQCIRCCGKGWEISASKSNDCFYFDVCILIRLNSICFFLFDFSFPLPLLFFFIACFYSILFSLSFTSDSAFQQNKCYFLVSPDYLIDPLVLYYFLNSFPIQV